MYLNTIYYKAFNNINKLKSYRKCKNTMLDSQGVWRAYQLVDVFNYNEES